MTQRENPQLRVVGPYELPRSLQSYAEVGAPLLDNVLRRKLGTASLWLQTHGVIYGISPANGDEAAIVPGGEFFLPVVYAGTRRLTAIKDYRSDKYVRAARIPRNPVAVFNLREANSDMSYMSQDVADYAQIGIRPEQPIALIDDEEYWSVIEGTIERPPLRLIVNNT